MIDFIIEIVAYFFVRILLEFPGAAVRWLWFRGRKKFWDLVGDDTHLNILLSLGIIGAIAWTSSII
ncbi:MAG: hypothetical protein ACO1N9_02085 [Flavobacterium sp.]